MLSRRTIPALLVLAGLLAPPRPAVADEPEVPDPDGWDIGLRVGYGVPLGSLAGSTAFDALMSGEIPLTFEVGKRFDRDYTAGIFFQYAFGEEQNGKTSGCGIGGPSCSSADYRFGVQILTHIGDFTRSFTPWFGFDLGYEVLTLSANIPGADNATLLHGFQATLEAGGDLHSTPIFSLGPYVGCSFGQFSTSGLGGPYGSDPPAAMHAWLQLGLRGAWSLSSP